MPFPYNQNYELNLTCSPHSNETRDNYVGARVYDKYSSLPSGRLCYTPLGTRNACRDGPCINGPDDLGLYRCGYGRNARYIGYPGVRLAFS